MLVGFQPQVNIAPNNYPYIRGRNTTGCWDGTILIMLTLNALRKLENITLVESRGVGKEIPIGYCVRFH